MKKSLLLGSLIILSSCHSSHKANVTNILNSQDSVITSKDSMKNKSPKAIEHGSPNKDLLDSIKKSKEKYKQP